MHYLCSLKYFFQLLPNEPTFRANGPDTFVMHGNARFFLVTRLIVRDSSAVRRLFVRLAGAVGRQSTPHKENSGFAAPTPGRHISTFRGYQILFSIQNPYINRFTNHFSIHS